jgi:hypothetical protein
MARMHEPHVERRDEIEQMDRRLMRESQVRSAADLYALLRQADFHDTFSDPLEHWNVATYAAFSGTVLDRELSGVQLRGLLHSFRTQKEHCPDAWGAKVVQEIEADIHLHSERDHVAIGFRYACEIADNYIFPQTDLMGRLDDRQRDQLNNYLDYVQKNRNVAGRLAASAARRQLNDLVKQNAGTATANLDSQA